MRYLVLVTDYDGTLAIDGKADESTLSALERLRMSGRRAICVSQREHTREPARRTRID